MENAEDCGFQIGKSFCCDGPYYLGIHSEVGMDDDVAKAHHSFPVDLTMGFSNGVRDVLYSFPDDLQIADDAVDDKLILGEHIWRKPRCVTLYFANGIQDIVSKEAPVTFRH